MSPSLETAAFPGETREYRNAREELLRAEIALRRQVEAVAALRRKLPLGGLIREDYEFDEGAPSLEEAGMARKVRLSQLFAPGKDSLIIYSFMYGPNAAKPCPMCTSILDSLDGAAPHVAQRANLAVVARSPLARIREFARSRGWRNLRLLSAAGNDYQKDYHAETPDGAQWPALNVFVRRPDGVHHFYAAELLFSPADPGQNERHADLIWPLWNLLDLTPEGRGTDWFPRLNYSG